MIKELKAKRQAEANEQRAHMAIQAYAIAAAQSPDGKSFLDTLLEPQGQGSAQPAFKKQVPMQSMFNFVPGEIGRIVTRKPESDA